MKKVIISLSVLALGFMSSCQQEDLVNESSQAKSSIEVKASLEEQATSRTQLGEGYKVLWSEKDAIHVFGSEKGRAKYGIKEAGKPDGVFGEIAGNIDWQEGNEKYIGVYPYLENTEFGKGENGFVIETVIPTNQTFIAGSFDKNVAPMVSVSEDNEFAFKNASSIIIVPLKGEAKILSATLESENKIAGAATISVNEANGWTPSVDVTNGENKVVVSCGDGVDLKDEATNFVFVLAPGIYKDLTITFVDSDYKEYKIVLPSREYFRSGSFTLKEREYKGKVTEKDLWIKAEAPAYADAERMIPAIDNLNYIGWIKDLASNDKDELCSLLKRAATQAALGKYKDTYDILGGIPGFKKETKRFRFVGEDTQKLQYTYTQYLQSLMAEINEIDSADEFVEYVTKLSVTYEGIEYELDNTLGTIGDLLGKYESILGKFDILGILDTIMDTNITQLLLEYAENKDGLIYKTIDKLFEYDSFVNKVKESLTTVVKKYEELENSKIDKENENLRENAIHLTKDIAITKAQGKAAIGIVDAINAENKANLDNLNKGPWGILKKIIAWEPCVKYFEECNLTQVREVLLTLCENVELMISYEKVGITQYEYAKEDYTEEKRNEIWWMLDKEPAI